MENTPRNRRLVGNIAAASVIITGFVCVVVALSESERWAYAGIPFSLAMIVILVACHVQEREWGRRPGDSNWYGD